MSQPNFAGFAGGLSLLGLLAASSVHGQGLGNSPYSRLGLGDANSNSGGVRQLSMGGVGIAAPNNVNVNELNPALLFYSSRTTFEGGYSAQVKTLRNGVNSQRTGSANLGYLALSVPINSRWAGAVGLKPYSTVDYESNTTNRVAGDTTALAQSQYKGSGGLAEAYTSHAVKIAKGLTLGASAGYVFGSIDQQAGTVVVNSVSTVETTTRSIYLQHVHYSDFTFRGAAHYRGKLTDKVNFNLGAVHSFQSNLNGERSIYLNRETLEGVSISSLTIENELKGKATVPGLTQVGISLDDNKNWSVNLDGSRQEWSKFRAFNEAGGSSGVLLSNTYRVGLGGEITPDATSVDNYFKRVTYRMGLNMAQLPYRPGGNTLYDRSVSWGFALPVPTATPLEATTISLGFQYGQRGNTDSRTLADGNVERNVKESYVKMQLGVTLNNRWFLKRKIE